MNAKRNIILLLCFMFCVQVFVQAQQSHKIEIISAQSMEYDENIGDRAMRLIGDVVLRHEDAYMYCDSGYLYRETNSFLAFDNVRIIHGDSLMLTGSRLHYFGNTQVAEMRDTVVLIHNNSILETDSLNYNRIDKIAYYFGGGEIFDEDNHLYSLRGYYYTKDKDYYAVDSVILINPQYKMYADTLRYNTDSEISFFYGPTHIVSDSNYIYCENGYYDTHKDISAFSENAYLISGEQTLKGDSLFYDRNKQMGEAFMNVSVIDTTDNIIALGNYALYYEKPESALLTNRAQIIYISDGDSLFIHADTILIDIDTLDNKLIRAYYHVQAFKSDAQARCDSLVYSSADSISEMFGQPVLWAENNQLTSEKMEMHFRNEKAHHILMKGYAFIVSPEEADCYSQIKGRELIAYFKDNDIHRIDIFNDSQTLYYVRDEDTGELVGLNKVICNDMIIYRNNKQVERIKFFQQPDGMLIPMNKITSDQRYLKDFNWLEDYRPLTRYDIFLWHNLQN